MGWPFVFVLLYFVLAVRGKDANGWFYFGSARKSRVMWFGTGGRVPGAGVFRGKRWNRCGYFFTDGIQDVSNHVTFGWCYAF
ncbi:hypothetical protein LY78DRAFT_145572 [Colletotrichum sublineola]|nr:hypothetical protein LY78DRAFT_145572 [Colletotrichum sublineola]